VIYDRLKEIDFQTDYLSLSERIRQRI